MRSLANGFSYIMDLINEDVNDHHQKVAYLSYRIAEEMHLPDNACHLAIVGGLMHDIGGILQSQTASLADIEKNASSLAKAGAEILKLLPTTAPIAEVIFYSQSGPGKLNALDLPSWLKLIKNMPEHLRLLHFARIVGQIIHLADAITLIFDENASVLNQVEIVRETLDCAPREHFHPWVMDAFHRLCKQEAVWMDLLYEPSAFLRFISESRGLSLDDMCKASEFASVMIDFRSPFTAMHSSGVAATAVELAKLVGMSEDECKMMKIAGNVHDIGKLKTPKEILEKNGKLTDEEFNIIKEHSYYTYMLLKRIDGMGQIAEWAAFHHEKLNGSGYPFHLPGDSLHFGARIVAVADIFSALTEDRPYRGGMGKEKALSILHEDVQRGEISGTIVDILEKNYDRVNAARAEASYKAGKRYRESMKSVNESGEPFTQSDPQA